jgi:hypothetical protein
VNLLEALSLYAQTFFGQPQKQIPHGHIMLSFLWTSIVYGLFKMKTSMKDLLAIIITSIPIFIVL